MPLFRDEGGKDAPPESESDRAARRAERSLETSVDTFVGFWSKAKESCISKEMLAANSYREQLENETFRLANKYVGFPVKYWEACHDVIDLAGRTLRECEVFEVGDPSHYGEIQSYGADPILDGLHSIASVDLRSPAGSEVSRAGGVENSAGSDVGSVLGHLFDEVGECTGS